GDRFAIREASQVFLAREYEQGVRHFRARPKFVFQTSRCPALDQFPHSNELPVGRPLIPLEWSSGRGFRFSILASLLHRFVVAFRVDEDDVLVARELLLKPVAEADGHNQVRRVFDFHGFPRFFRLRQPRNFSAWMIFRSASVSPARTASARIARRISQTSW